MWYLKIIIAGLIGGMTTSALAQNNYITHQQGFYILILWAAAVAFFLPKRKGRSK